MGRHLVLGVLLLATALSSCAGAGAPGQQPASGSPSPRSPSPPSSPAGGSELVVVVDDGQGVTSTWRLTCSPPGGDHPDPAAACAALEKNGQRALPPVAKDRACTQVYGGAQTATVTGTWQGRSVDSRFSLTNGCEIARWKSLAGLLPPAGA